MAINISVQYNGGLLLDSIMLTQGYYHRGTRLNTMYGMYSSTYSKSMDQPGKVASPARGQLNRKNEYFAVVRVRSCLRIWSRETGSAVPSRVPAHLHTQAESGAYLLDSSRVPRRRPCIHL